MRRVLGIIDAAAATAVVFVACGTALGQSRPSADQLDAMIANSDEGASRGTQNH
jgi:hypothetical protein